MKYVIIQDRDGLEFPVFCVAPITHAQLAAAFRPDDSRRVVAAGFVEFLPTGAAIVFGRSESLNIGTRPDRDGALIAAMHLGTVRMAREAEFGTPAPRGPRELSPALREEIVRQVTSLQPTCAH